MNNDIISEEQTADDADNINQENPADFAKEASEAGSELKKLETEIAALNDKYLQL